MCRLMCHCVRHISLDNKHERSIDPSKRYTRHDHVGGMARSLCRHTGRAVGQEELDGEREPSEEIQG